MSHAPSPHAPTSAHAPTPPATPAKAPTPPASAALLTPPASAYGLPRRPSRRRHAGTSVVEMAIVLPLLLTLVFAIGEFGIAFTQWQTLINAAREGARTGVLFRGASCVPATVKTQVASTVSNYMSKSGIASGALSTSSSGECAGSGTELSVTSQVPYTFAALPGLAGLESNIMLSASSTMRNE
jgi:Flp pilus assembly protein TadG